MEIKEVQQRIAEIEKLPSSPELLNEIVKLIRDPASSIRDFEKVIQRDPSIATQVMRVANSPYYALSRKITNLRLALSLLGLDEIYRIALNVSVYRGLRRSFPTVSFVFNLFWQHSQETAKMGEILATEIYASKSLDIYVLGLIHDVGKLILDQYFSDEWTEVLLQFAQTGEDVTRLEKRILGITHAEVGGELLRQWGLPPDIVSPIIHHHTPFEEEKFRLNAILLYAADKTVAWLTPDEIVHQSTQENLEKDETWEQVINQYPGLDVLKDEQAKAHYTLQLKNLLSQEI